jgi:LemA protein
MVVSCSVLGIVISIRAARTVQATPVGKLLEFRGTRKAAFGRDMELDAGRKLDAPPERARRRSGAWLSRRRRGWAAGSLVKRAADFIERASCFLERLHPQELRQVFFAVMIAAAQAKGLRKQPFLDVITHRPPRDSPQIRQIADRVPGGISHRRSMRQLLSHCQLAHSVWSPPYNPAMTLMILLAVLVVVVLAVVGIYNGLVKLNVQSSNAWADIDVQLKRRHDLIPNVVETVKGYASHERQTLEAVINARNRAVSAESAGPAERGQAEGALTGALRGLFALAESYPQLRAAENFGQLQNTLAQIEDAIQNARRYYNAVVRDLNTRIQQFPSNVIAGMFGFKNREFFEIPDTEKQTPQVKF